MNPNYTRTLGLVDGLGWKASAFCPFLNEKTPAATGV